MEDRYGSEPLTVGELKRAINIITMPAPIPIGISVDLKSESLARVQGNWFANEGEFSEHLVMKGALATLTVTKNGTGYRAQGYFNFLGDNRVDVKGLYADLDLPVESIFEFSEDGHEFRLCRAYQRLPRPKTFADCAKDGKYEDGFIVYRR